jgi:transcription elongation factor Elf1
MSDWMPVTDEKLTVEAHEPWYISCPHCEREIISLWGKSGPYLTCPVCGATVQVGLRVVDDHSDTTDNPSEDIS